MSLITDMHAYLVGVTALTDLVSTRIRPHKANSSDTMPYITYERVTYNGERHLGGPSKLASEGFDFYIYSKTMLEADNVITALREALDGYQGLMGSTNVRNVIYNSANNIYLPPDHDDQEGDFRALMTFVFWHVQSVPSVP